MIALIISFVYAGTVYAQNQTQQNQTQQNTQLQGANQTETSNQSSQPKDQPNGPLGQLYEDVT
jgi:hypothetical protein